LTIEDNLMERNTSSTSSGTCVFASGCAGNIRGNTFVNNRILGSGGGNFVYVNSRTNIVGNTFHGSEVAPGIGDGVVALDACYDGPFSFRLNVIAGSRGVPAVVLQECSYRPTDGCNVFWDNPAGNFVFYTPQPTDVVADPLFCDPSTGDFTVREGSPCLPGGVPTCGEIGAWGMGCGVVSVEPTSWGEIKSLYREGDAR
jgi:hypothetical protein